MRLLKRLSRDRKGNVLMIGAAAMPLIVGSAALAVDTVQVSLLRRHLQRAADSGALAGAYAKVQAMDVEGAAERALEFNNAFPIATSAIEEPATGTHANRAVRVQLSAKRSLPFWSFFGVAPTITVEATAALVYSGQYCMVSLDEEEGSGINFAGSAEIDASCGIISNSSGSKAVDVDGNAVSVKASPIAAVGGVPYSDRYVQPTLLLPYSLKQKDPFGEREFPEPPTSCAAAITDNTTPVPGTCYSGLNVDIAKTFPSGTYYISGNFSLNSKAIITAHEVTFVFIEDPDPDVEAYPQISINGGAKVDLTAPKSGDYEGIVMHYDSDAPEAGHKINGGSGSTFEGAFYFPTQNLTFNGNSTVNTTCIQLVAFRLTFEGKTKITNQCSAAGTGAKAFDAEWVRLVK